MLTGADNELMCRVGAGTPMGELVRRYWIPFLLTSHLSDRDGRPRRVRLLGENLIAFRDTDNRVGLIAENCPHRGASLFFGRNEESGLRCVYHGWKFDPAGACVDMPNEPAESNFKDKVRAVAYPCAERNGVLWTYMGPRSQPPPLPGLEWNLVPEEQRHLSLRVQQCNWVQAMEGAIDASHVTFLHGQVNYENAVRVGAIRGRSRSAVYQQRDTHPRFESLDTEYGAVVVARRNAEEDTYYWRINHFLLPFYTVFAPSGDDPALSGHAWVPIDDQNTLVLCLTYHATKPLSSKALDGLEFDRDGIEGLHASASVFLPETSAPYGSFLPKINRENDYCLDWENQKMGRFSGLPGLWPQDAGVQETMGPICDRTNEHLGSSDGGLIHVRRRLINAARALREDGAEPSGIEPPEVHGVRAAAAVLPRDVPWVEGISEQVRATPGVNYSAV